MVVVVTGVLFVGLPGFSAGGWFAGVFAGASAGF